MAIDDPVQPPEGQGGESGGTSPWESYLDRIPEEARGAASEAFKEFDANTTRKFQDHADYRKTWEPFEQLGVQERDPDVVQWGLQFTDALQNPAAIKQWYEDYARENGLTDQEQDPPFVDPDVESLVQQRLQDQLNPVAEQLAELAQWRQGQEEQAREAEAQSLIRSQLDALSKEDGFDESQVEMLIPRHMDDPENAVNLAWEDLKALRGQIQKETLQGKLNVPPGAEAGGVPDGTPELPSQMSEARKIAVSMLRQDRFA